MKLLDVILIPKQEEGNNKYVCLKGTLHNFKMYDIFVYDMFLSVQEQAINKWVNLI